MSCSNRYFNCRIYGLDFDDSTGSAENEDDEDLTPFERRAKRMTPQDGFDGLRKRVCHVLTRGQGCASSS